MAFGKEPEVLRSKGHKRLSEVKFQERERWDSRKILILRVHQCLNNDSNGIHTLEYYSGIIKSNITSYIEVGMVLDRKHCAK